MNTSQGKVEIITEKAAGNGFAYNFKLSDGEWYGHGFAKPKFAKGASVKFMWEANGKWRNVDTASVEVVEDARPVVHTAPKASGGVDWDGKDKRITFLACRNTAVEITKMALEHGAVKLGAKDKLAILVATVEEVAGDLYTGIYGEAYPTTDVTTEAAATAAGADNDEE